jgi:acetyl-CoA carboxylase carboxyl transferase subunit alpha
LTLGIIDEIIEEPVGGAHRDSEAIAEATKQSIIKNLNFFKNLSREEIYEDRKSKFLKIGRDKGFIKSSNFKDRGLSYDEPLVQKTIKHIILNKYIYGGISLIILIGIITIFN